MNMKLHIPLLISVFLAAFQLNAQMPPAVSVDVTVVNENGGKRPASDPLFVIAAFCYSGAHGNT